MTKTSQCSHETERPAVEETEGLDEEMSHIAETIHYSHMLPAKHDRKSYLFS